MKFPQGATYAPHRRGRNKIYSFGRGCLRWIFYCSLSALASADNPLNQQLTAAQNALSSGQHQTALAQFTAIANKFENPTAQFTVGLFYQNGWGIATNPIAACTWFKLAADGGLPLATFKFGQCLANGLGREANHELAVSYYKRAAAAGYAPAHCAAADIYLSQWQQPKQALQQCQQAAEQGLTSAQLQIANYLAHGAVEIRNPEAAIYWYQQAAQTGSAAAAYQLALLLRMTDPAQSGFWFETAASHGYVAAYLPTANFYYEKFFADTRGELAEAYLAKTYLWLRASQQGTQPHPSADEISTMLARIQHIMPAEWRPALDRKIALHLQQLAKN